MAETIEDYLATRAVVVRTIVVDVHAGGYVSLSEGDRTTGELGVDEALSPSLNSRTRSLAPAAS